jgi:hypothetical protein
MRTPPSLSLVCDNKEKSTAVQIKEPESQGDFVQVSKPNILNKVYWYLVGYISGKNWSFVICSIKGDVKRQISPRLAPNEFFGIQPMFVYRTTSSVSAANASCGHPSS